MAVSIPEVVRELNTLPPEKIAEVYDFVLFLKTRPGTVVLTTKIASATQPSDYVLQDWQAAGLRRPSAFRAFLFTLPSKAVSSVGRLSDRDWSEVQDRLRIAVECEIELRSGSHSAAFSSSRLLPL